MRDFPIFEELTYRIYHANLAYHCSYSVNHFTNPPVQLYIFEI